MTKNKYVLNWIDEMAAMTKPDKIVWIDGTEEQAEALRAEACSTGEMIKLNQELLPNCYLHRTAVNDVARVEGRTYICTEKKEDAGNINNWMAPKEMYAKLNALYKDSYKGRTMYVIPLQFLEQFLYNLRLLNRRSLSGHIDRRLRFRRDRSLLRCVLSI